MEGKYKLKKKSIGKTAISISSISRISPIQKECLKWELKWMPKTLLISLKVLLINVWKYLGLLKVNVDLVTIVQSLSK